MIDLEFSPLQSKALSTFQFIPLKRELSNHVNPFLMIGAYQFKIKMAPELLRQRILPCDLTLLHVEYFQSTSNPKVFVADLFVCNRRKSQLRRKFQYNTILVRNSRQT